MVARRGNRNRRRDTDPTARGTDRDTDETERETDQHSSETSLEWGIESRRGNLKTLRRTHTRIHTHTHTHRERERQADRQCSKLGLIVARLDSDRDGETDSGGQVARQ